MIPLIHMDEQSFASMKELRNALAEQDRRDYIVPHCKICLNEEGILYAGNFEGPLLESALYGLLNSFQIPKDYGVKVCPDDLLLTTVQRLTREQNAALHIQSVNGVATGIMPDNRQPIRHDVLIDWLGVEHPIQEAILQAENLRILSVKNEFKELLPDDAFGYGWELINNEDGWHSTEANRFVLRMICTNGMVGFDKTASFRRGYNSRKPVLASIDRLVHTIENAMEPAELEAGIKWAANTPLGSERRKALDYMGKQLEGDVTLLATEGLTDESSWYDLLNEITSLAKQHRLNMRRRYEIEGGILLNWYLHQGRSRPPWRRSLCESCDTWRHN